MDARIALGDAQRSGVGMCLYAPQYMRDDGFMKPVVLFTRAASNVAAFAAAPLGVIVNLGRAGKAGLDAFKIRGNAQQANRYETLKSNLKSNLGFAALDTTVSVALYFLSWKVLAVVFIARQIKPDYAVIAYKKFTVLVTEGYQAMRGRQVRAGEENGNEGLQPNEL